MMKTIESFMGKLELSDQVTLGELVELADYDPQLLNDFIEKAVEAGSLYLDPVDTQDADGVEIWDGCLWWNHAEKAFYFVGADGPSGGDGNVQRLIHANDKFVVSVFDYSYDDDDEISDTPHLDAAE